MFKIIVLAVGKIKESFYQQAFAEYIKRLQPYVKLSVVEVKAEPFSEQSDKNKVKQIEGLRLVKEMSKIKQGSFFILDERGKEYTSPQLAVKLNNLSQPLVFVIGGSLGLSKEVLLQSQIQVLSLSKMTLPHELARVVLIEQIYRSVTILKNKTYHY